MGQLGRAQRARLVKLKDLSATEISAGQTPVIDFASVIDPVDADGRFSHLVGFMIKCAFSATTATSMDGAMGAFMLMAMLQNIRLMAGGRDYIRNLNGAELWKLGALKDRSWGPFGPQTDVADANASLTQTVRFPFFFGPGVGSGGQRWGREFDGAIPIAALQQARDATSGLRFTIAPATGAQLYFGGTAFAGVTDITITAATVYAYVMHDREPHCDTWLAESLSETRVDFVHQPNFGGYTELLAIGEEYNGSSWQNGQTGYSAIQVQAGGDYLRKSETYGNLVDEWNGEGLSDVGAANQYRISATAPKAIPLISAVQGESRTQMQSGPIRVQFARSAPTTSTLLAFARTLKDDNYLNTIARACGVEPKWQMVGTRGTSPAREKQVGIALPVKFVGKRLGL